jgi:hypothetical protein
MVKRIFLFALLLAQAFGGALQAASLEATVSSTSVVEGESVALYLEGVDLTEMPDISALYPNFDVLDSRTSEQMSFINGLRSTKNIWRFELMAKSPGNSVIPAFTADGLSTDPIVINVQARGAPGAVPRDDIFFELSVDNAEPWVQGQVVLTISVFDGVDITSGSLTEPESPDLQIERLPDLPQQIVERDGIEYRLITRRYALFPQRSGEIVIAPLQLSANIRDIDTHGQRRYSQNRRVTIRSESLTLKVKARPAESTSAWWLPVAEINLTSEWSGDIDSSVVGEPLTRTLVLTALGATETQLPEISVTSVDGLKIYPDAAQLDAKALDTGLVSARQEKWSIIPQRPGTHTLPAITIKWWDTKHDAERETTLPAEVIEVMAADSSEAPPTPPVDSAAPLALTPDGSVSEVADAAVRPDAPGYWMWLALMATSGWLVTLLAWWRQRRPATVESEPAIAPVTADALLQQVGKASKTGDTRQFRSALLHWARRQWPTKPPLQPAEIGRRLGDDALTEALARIDASIYSEQPSSIDMPELYTKLRAAASRHNTASPPAAADPLPQL